MNILVTGSNGFIGGHVCDYLIKNGNYVIGLGRKSSSNSVCNEYICCNLADEHTFEIPYTVNVDKIDAVVHLAADMRHEPFESEVVLNNCTGTQRLLEMCERSGIGVFVQLSSLPVIGLPVTTPITESHSVHPPTVYHTTKYMQELLAEYAHYTHNIRTVSLRICSPVGKGDNPKTIFPTFVSNAKHGNDIVIFGNGTRKQTFIHVTDIADAILKCIMSDACGVYNLASNNLISNYDLAVKCKDVLASKSNIVFSGKPDKYDNVKWEISFEKLSKDTGFVPKMTVEDCIRDVAKYV